MFVFLGRMSDHFLHCIAFFFSFAYLTSSLTMSQHISSYHKISRLAPISSILGWVIGWLAGCTVNGFLSFGRRVFVVRYSGLLAFWEHCFMI